ncbi:hypothetical protein K56PH164C1_LOCUS20 [Klebsiella phage vB_Kpl_K56PH164C1]|uniref:Uncharacterized protein n=1 Tax=Klebsiella phage vB_Kpl_K56PH164C1 TaxID=3071653 RepID=A0AAV1MBX3_9CAUD|nr:hypothetical protein K56PH164C1_LOCUS20 [Klebsiella phage vB_Kpl_K56PH164C1]
MAFAKKKIYTTKIGTCEPYAYFNKPDYGGEGPSYCLNLKEIHHGIR